MKWVVTITVVLMLAAPATGLAQSSETRPATPTAWGDTGMWFVPTAEVMPTGNFSFSLQRTEFDFRQGNSSVSSYPITGSVGIGRFEIFGSLQSFTRIDRDANPLFFAGPNNEAGGLLNDYPTLSETWSGSHLGDLYLGTKLNLASQGDAQPLAVAFRGTMKVPTADSKQGVGTGQLDGFFDLVGSREMGNVEIGGFGGIALRGDPDEISVSDSIRWGGGAAFPTRSSLRVTTEMYGEWMFDRNLTAPAGLLVGTDGSLSPATSRLEDTVNAAVGLTWQHPGGVLFGAALNYRFALSPSDPSSGLPQQSNGNAWGMEFRIGFNRGVRVFSPPPPPAIAAAPPAPPPAVAPPAPQPVAAAPPANRAPVVKAVCAPCRVTSGASATLSVQASDPDGDALTYRWATSGGTLSDTRSPATSWRAETGAGLVTFTVVAEDGRGGVASDMVTIAVGDAERYQFEDVHFDLDSSRLRAEAPGILAPALAALKDHPTLQLLIEGHTCSLGTAEYNLALGERRANAVRDYLVQNGIDVRRLTTTSFGEERPIFDNAKEETRQLNRRAVLVVRLTDEGESR